MANYKAVANGNWSNLATWQDNSSGSFVASTVLPGAADVVYWNNFTVAINQDVTVLQIRSDSTTGVTAGGGGTVSTSRTINANLFHATGTLITISAASPSVVNINGNMPGTVANNSSRGVVLTNNCTLNYVGNIKGADITLVNRQDCKAIILATGATINLTGDIFAGTNTSPSTSSSENIGIASANGATINVVGNLDGGTGARNRAISGSTNDTITVTGNVYGGNGSTLGSLNGILIGATTISCNIVGNVSSGPNSYGINSGSTTPVIITGNLQNYSNGLIAVSVPYLFLNSTNMQWEFRKLDLTTNTLYTPGVATGHPATNNVRTGITYGPTNNLTGTCAVPPANAVSVGVPVDNTVGTASLDANALAAALNTSLQASLPAPISASLQASLPTPISASLQASLPTPIATALNTSLSASLPAAIAPLLWDEDVTNITTPNSIGERLKNCATVATTGAQISSFNP